MQLKSDNLQFSQICNVLFIYLFAMLLNSFEYILIIKNAYEAFEFRYYSTYTKQ